MEDIGYRGGLPIVDAVKLAHSPVCYAVLTVLCAADREWCVKELSHQVGWVQSQVSTALGLMKAAGWVVSREVGTRHLFRTTAACPMRIQKERVVIVIKSFDGEFRRSCPLRAGERS